MEFFTEDGTDFCSELASELATSRYHTYMLILA